MIFRESEGSARAPIIGEVRRALLFHRCDAPTDLIGGGFTLLRVLKIPVRRFDGLDESGEVELEPSGAVLVRRIAMKGAVGEVVEHRFIAHAHLCERIRGSGLILGLTQRPGGLTEDRQRFSAGEGAEHGGNGVKTAGSAAGSGTARVFLAAAREAVKRSLSGARAGNFFAALSQ